MANLKNAVLSHPDVVAFKTAFHNAFGDFDAYLKSALIDGMTQLNAAGEEERLSREIFARLAEIPLVDRYAAYQLLDDDWKYRTAGWVMCCPLSWCRALKCTRK